MLKFRHVLSTSAATLVAGGFSLLLAVVCARMLTPAENGHYSQYLLIMNLIYIGFNFGLGTSSTYHLAAGFRSLSDMLVINLRFVGILALVFLLLGVVLASTSLGMAVEKYFKVPLMLIYVGLVAGVVLVGLNQVVALLMGLHRYDQANLVNVVRTAAPLPLVLLASFALGGEMAISLAQTLALAVVLVWSALLLLAIDGCRSPSLRRGVRDLMSYGSLAYLSNLLHFAAMRGLLLFISFYSGPEQVGFFNLSLLLLEALLLLPSAIGQLVFPQSSSPSFNRLLVEKLLRINLYIGFLVATIVLFTLSVLVNILFGAAYAPVGEVFSHLTPAIVLMTLPRVLSQLLSGSGHPGYPLTAAVLSSMLGFVLALWWIPESGIIGAAWIINTVAMITATVTVFGYCKVYAVHPLQLLMPRIADLAFIVQAKRRS